MKLSFEPIKLMPLLVLMTSGCLYVSDGPPVRVIDVPNNRHATTDPAKDIPATQTPPQFTPAAPMRTLPDPP